MQAEAALQGLELPALPSSPIPRDRPEWRSVDISFLLLYYKHPWTMDEIAARLWGCTHGYLGTGTLRGLTSEFIVNVDSRVREGLG